MYFKLKPFRAAMALAIGGAMSCVALPAMATDSTSVKNITIIQMGDIHGHLMPRQNVRSDKVGRMEGGLARMKTKIDSIRSNRPNNLLINTGDTTQGSGEALYTRGKAMVDVIDLFKVDVFAPGNWDFVYGKARFQEFFADTTVTPAKSKRWGALAGNVYNTSTSAPVVGALKDPLDPASAKYTAADVVAWYVANGEHVLPATSFKLLGGVKIGVIGCTSSRGPQVVGAWVSDGLFNTDCTSEVLANAANFRSATRPSSGTGDPGGAVDVVILASEIEVGRSIQVLKSLDATNHIDFVFNSDMHEEVSKPIRVTTAAGFTAMIVEQGMDGTALGEMGLKVDIAKPVGSRIVGMEYKQHRIDSELSENSTVKSKIASVRKPYVIGNYVKPVVCDSTSIYWNMFSETCLHGPLDAVVGLADADLHRSNFSDEPVTATLEGSSHNWIADGIRWWAKADAATVRGFRYGTTVKAGSKIVRNDLFHYIPVGPRVAKVSRINVTQLRNQVDNSSRSVFGQDPGVDWRGGWMFAYSADGFSLKFDPYSVSLADNNANNGNPLYAPLTAAEVTAGKVDKFAGMRKPSRARDFTVNMPCALLPVTEQAACIGVAQTKVTNNVDGDWTPSWNTAFTAKTVYNLAPGAIGSTSPWKLTTSSITKPFQSPVLSAAGYWFRRAPDTINNCENCFPSGSSNDKTLSTETPYLLPVNADANGAALVDANGVPVVKVYTQADADAALIPAGFKVGDWVPGADGKPQSLGRPIDLVEIMEGFLKTRNANPTTGRVTLWNGATLPGRTVFGFPVMQPLCGTIGLTATTACP